MATGRKADDSVRGIRCTECGRKNRWLGIREWNCVKCGAYHEPTAERPRYEAFSSISKRVGQWEAEQDVSGNCYDSLTPDIWFMDEFTKGEAKQEYAYQSVLVAVRMCNECPIQKACLKYAMSDEDAIKYGIWGGTFAFERLGIGSKKSSAAHTYQKQLRKRLISEEGLTAPEIPAKVTRERKETKPINIDKRVAKLVAQGLSPAEMRAALKTSHAAIADALSRVSPQSA